MTNPEPFIYVLDIDGTVIGDITYQVAEWEILKLVDPRKLKVFKQNLIDHLRSGLLRPQLADFIMHLKTINSNSEFFMYTASDDKWAQFLVPCIEAACNVKFARPIFSRKHCIFTGHRCMKSLSKISNAVYNKVKSKMGFKKPAHVLEHMILIDNNNVLLDKEARRGIICPSYNYKQPYDVLRTVDLKLLHDNMYTVSKVLAKYDLIDDKMVNSKYSSFQILAAYYGEFANRLNHLSKSSSAIDYESKDKFWMKLANAIIALQQKKVSKDTIVKYVNSKF